MAFLRCLIRLIILQLMSVRPKAAKKFAAWPEMCLGRSSLTKNLHSTHPPICNFSTLGHRHQVFLCKLFYSQFYCCLKFLDKCQLISRQKLGSSIFFKKLFKNLNTCSHMLTNDMTKTSKDLS